MHCRTATRMVTTLDRTRVRTQKHTQTTLYCNDGQQATCSLFKSVERYLCALFIYRTIWMSKETKRIKAKQTIKKPNAKWAFLLIVRIAYAFVSILLFLSSVRIYLSVSVISAFVLMQTFVSLIRLPLPCAMQIFFFLLFSSVKRLSVRCSQYTEFQVFPWLKSHVMSRVRHTKIGVLNFLCQFVFYSSEPIHNWKQQYKKAWHGAKNQPKKTHTHTQIYWRDISVEFWAIQN